MRTSLEESSRNIGRKVLVWGRLDERRRRKIDGKHRGI
jgi:hypothetical protein